MKKGNLTNRQLSEVERLQITRAAAPQLDAQEIAEHLFELTGKIGYRLLSSAIQESWKEKSIDDFLQR